MFSWLVVSLQITVNTCHAEITELSGQEHSWLLYVLGIMPGLWKIKVAGRYLTSYSVWVSVSVQAICLQVLAKLCPIKIKPSPHQTLAK